MILRSALLLLRLRARRLLNLLSGRRKRAVPRGGTGRPMSWALPLVVIVMQAVALTALAWMAIANARKVHDGADAFDAHRLAPLSAAVQLEITLLAGLACTVGLLMGVGSRELASPDWDLEWLATLPIPMRQLLAVRLVERAVLNPAAVLLIWTLLSVAALHQGAGWMAPLLGALVAAPLLLVVGSVHLLIDTGLRLRMSPPRLRNVQALCALLGLVGLYLVISAGQSDSSFLHALSDRLPDVVRWTPTGLAVRALAPDRPLAALGALLGEWALCLLVVLGVLAWLAHLLRHGLLAAGARESARGSRPLAAAPKRGVRRLVTALQARELKLLARDRAFMVQTLVLPVVILGAQFLLNTRVFGDLLENPRILGGAAFAFMSYALLFSTFQTLAAEGHALWLLFTFPLPLDRLLREKARLWSVVSLLLPATIFATGLFFSSHADWSAGAVAALVLLGVPIFATIGTCLGVLGWDPLALDQRRRVRPGWAWLFMLLASAYTWALVSATWWQAAVVVTLTGALALSLWQRVRDRLPWLLDAGNRPPPRVALADGMLAALLFFVLQSLAALAFARSSDAAMIDFGTVTLAYVTAGALTFATLQAIFRSTRAEGVPRYAGSHRPLRATLLPALVAAAGVAAWVLMIRRAGLFTEAMDMGRRVLLEWPVAMPLLAVVVAPVFEEFVFRGLVFGGLRRSRGFLVSALVSAAVFAVVHPPIDAVPVFALGLLTATAYELSGALAAPVCVHAAFNAASLVTQLLAR